MTTGSTQTPTSLANLRSPSGGLPLVGHAVRIIRDGPDFLAHTARQFGDVTVIRLGPQRFVFVNHPELYHDIMVKSVRSFEKGVQFDKFRDLLGNGLVTSRGALHRRQRRMAQPAFHRGPISRYAKIMSDLTVAQIAPWQDGSTVDISAELVRLTLDIVSTTLFSSTMAKDAVAELGKSIPIVLKGVEWRVAVGIDALERLPLPANRRYDAAIVRVTTAIDNVIARYQESAEDHGDLLSMLMLAVDDETNETMDNRQLRDEVLTMLVAGHETTASALAWSFYLLTRHPDVEQRLHHEVDGVLGGRPVEMDDLPKLPFTRAVLAETLRLYPPGWLLTRRTVAQHELGGVTLPVNTSVMVSPYTMHRDSRFWTDADAFDPDRWLPERAEEINRKAYVPFSSGNRQCIGDGFAWTEGMIILATIATGWKLGLPAGFQPKRRAGTTLHPGPLVVSLQRRT